VLPHIEADTFKAVVLPIELSPYEVEHRRLRSSTVPENYSRQTVIQGERWNVVAFKRLANVNILVPAYHLERRTDIAISILYPSALFYLSYKYI
jgi:hypothetical protein